MFFLSYDIMITLKSHFWHKKVKILSLCMQCCGLSILIHGAISLPDVTPYDKDWCYTSLFQVNDSGPLVCTSGQHDRGDLIMSFDKKDTC